MCKWYHLRPSSVDARKTTNRRRAGGTAAAGRASTDDGRKWHAAGGRDLAMLIMTTTPRTFLVLPVTPPPPPLVALSLVYFIFSPVFRAFVPLAVFVLVNHHFPVVLGESTCRKWSESTKGKTWSGSELGRAGDGARELLPWTAWCSRTMCLAGERTALVLALGASSAPTADPPRSLLPACSP
jgi:hypothetical protein